MAVNETGAIFKALSFDGESSRTYGIYITGEAVYNAPERDVEMVTIPGRNGAFALDKGRFENIEVTYPAGMFADTEQDFAKGISDFRNMLCSRQGYCRLTDEYNPDEYRLAVYKSGLEVSPAQLRAGEFNITFECKPQRYLMSGQNKFIVGDWHDTDVETGDIVEIDNTSGAIEVKSAEVNLEPKQAGTPWQDSTLYKTPYLFRKVPSINHSINSKYTTLVGADVAGNQLAKALNSTNWSTSAAASAAFSNGVATVTPTGNYGSIFSSTIDFVKGHKYLMCADIKYTNASQNTRLLQLTLSDSTNFTNTKSIYATATWEKYYWVTNIADNVAPNRSLLSVRTVSDLDEFQVRNIMLIDLTAYYGSNTIADTAYTKEQATAGSGIAWLKANGFDFSKYRAFNAGSLESVNPSAIVTRGFNQWDEEWEVGNIDDSTGANGALVDRLRAKNYIPVLPSTNYYFYYGGTDYSWNCILYMYDANKNYLGNTSATRVTINSTNKMFTTTSDTHFIRFQIHPSYGTTYNHDICINLHWDGSRDGEYEQYSKHEYALGNVPLHGVFKLVDGNIQAVGDTRDAGGNVGVNFGQVDLGTLNWYYEPNYGGFFYSSTLTGTMVKKLGVTAGDVFICSAYACSAMLSNVADSDMVNTPDKTVTYHYAGAAAYVYIKDSAYADAATFKTAMSGVMLTYELATPTTDTADPFTNPQVVDNWGTEEFVTSNDVPVGNETRYADVYEITGTDELNTHVSPNLCDESTFINNYWYGADGALTASSGKIAVPRMRLYGKDKIAVSFDRTIQNTRFYWYVYGEDGSFLYWHSELTSDSSWQITDNRVGKIININYDAYPTAYYIAFAFDSVDNDVVGTISDVMMTFTNTVTDFIAYGDDYETALGETVYGCKADIIAGTGDKTFSSLDLGSLTWTLDVNEDGAKIYGATVSDIKPTQYWIWSRSGFYCDGLPLVLYDVDPTPDPDKFSDLHIGRYNTKVYVRDDNSANADELKRNVTGLTLVYPLNTPATLTFTAEDIDLAETVNYIWNDEGTVTVEYGTDPYMIVNPTLFGCGPLIETKGYGNISFNGHTISLANGAIGTVNLWNRTHGGSLNGSITKKFATGQFNPTDTFSFTVSHMFTLYEDTPSIVNTNANAVNDFRDNNDGSVTYWIDLPCTFTVNTTGQITNKSTYTFGSKKVIANMSVSYDSSTGTVVYSVTTETVNNPTFASSTQFGFTISDCNAASTLDRLGDPTYIDCDLGEAYKINDGDIVSLNSFIDLGSNLPELASGPNKITYDNTFTEVAITPRWWTV